MGRDERNSRIPGPSADVYLLRFDLDHAGTRLRAGTPLHKGRDGWYLYPGDTKVPIESESHICRAQYDGVLLAEVRCDDDGLFSVRRLGSPEAFEPVTAAHIGFDLECGAGCICVVYGSRYYSLDFFGW